MSVRPLASSVENGEGRPRFGGNVRMALELLGSRRLLFAVLIAKRVVVGICDLLLASALYLLFLQLQGGAPKHPLWWLPRTVLSTAGATLALVVGRAMLDLYSSRSILHRIQELYRELLFRLIRGYTEMQWGRFVERNRSELLNHVVQTTSEAAEYYHCCLELIASVIVVAIMAIALVYQNAAAACGLGVAIGAFYAGHRLFLRRQLRRAASDRERSLRALQRNLADMLSSGKEIRAYGNQNFFYGRVREHVDGVTAGNLRVLSLPQVARILADQGVLVLFLGVVIVVQLEHGQTSQLLSVLVFYFALSRRLLPLISQISFMLGKVESSFEVVRVLDEELKECSHHRASMQLSPTPNDGFALEIDQLRFVYPDGTCVVRDASLHLLSGEVAVLQGASGCGKSSLLNLIAGLLEPASGVVRVDRRRLAYMPQEVPLLDDTIENNLLFGIQEASEREMMRALEMARLADLIAVLPEGLATRIGDNGVLLSGGERQRLGLARAILRGASLILLDEATSALDEENERQVLENLSRSGAAVLLVTHRGVARTYAQRVFELRDGLLDEVSTQCGPESGLQAASNVL